MEGRRLGFIRLTMGVGIGGVLLAVIVWSLFPFLEPVWLIPLFFYSGVALVLIGVATFGIARYFAKPS